MPSLVAAPDIAAFLPDPVLLISTAGQVRWANPAAERLFGRRLDDSRGVNVVEFVHPDDVQTAALAMTSVQQKDVGTLLELRARSFDGWRLVEVRGAAVDDGILLSIRDITERRRWEVAGNDFARFRAVMQYAASLTFLVDEAGIVSSSSSGLTRLLGHDQEWLEGRPLIEILTPSSVPVVASALLDVVRRGSRVGSVSVEVHFRSATGTAIPYACTFSNLLDDPVVEGIVVTAHDISDRLRTEYELRSANSLLAATLESTSDGILVVDRDGRVANYNARFAEMWRIPEDVLRARNDEEALRYVVDQLKEPGRFLKTVEEVYASSASPSHDVLEFTDGRVFERDSLPQRIDGEVVGRVWSFRDVTEQHHLQRELAHQALHDSLTGLANQALFRDRLAHALQRLDRHPQGLLAVLFVDLDNFKIVNDSLGHWAGDVLLIQVGTRLTGAMRSADTAARLGGDEFALLIEDLGSERDAIDVADRLLAAIRHPIVLAAQEINVTASVGIAIGAAGSDTDDLLRSADLAMYGAKESGKNGYRMFTPEMHTAAVQKLELESSLRSAVRRGELVLHFQPIVHTPTGHIRGAEALVRWLHPKRGLLPPSEFIPFAEHYGLVAEVGREVLETACRVATGWPAQGGIAPVVSVNLAPQQLHNAHIAAEISALLRETGLAPDRLILEITENAMMSDRESAAARLSELHELGVQLAVDDFGTGHSSLAYLQKFPIDILKVDRTFIEAAPEHPEASIARAIVQLAHSLDLTPIAEGVETKEQAAAVIDYGCNLAQGFYFARPMEADALARLMRE